MTASPARGSHALLAALRGPAPLVGVEMRPPRSGLTYAEGMNAWIDMYHSIQRLVRRGRFIFLTDNTVGVREEENLAHLTGNLSGAADFGRIVPFLTCKHSRDYCLVYAQRAISQGFESLTVVGGDHSVGPPRCVPHAYQLRGLIRERVPSLTLGGWANPHRDPATQANFLAQKDFTGDYYLTQIVSHHHLRQVERFLDEVRRRAVPLRGIFGVFYYRSSNVETLARLGRYFPVPVEGLRKDFGLGLSPAEVCARTIRALRNAGVDRIYLSNLGVRRAAERHDRIMELLS